MTNPQAAVQRLIDELVASGRETGLQVAAYRGGLPLVDACAGEAHPGSAVDGRTLFNSWSTGKGTMSALVHVLAERGLLDDTAPVAEYWPEFAAHGKQAVTLAHVLTHSAGVPQAPEGVTLADLADWDGMCARIADLRPQWEAGTATGYHALTFGYILGEVVRRVTGRPIVQALREEITEPLGIADELLFGVPSAELPRVARLEDGNWAAIVASRPAGSAFFEAAPPAIQPGPDLGNRTAYLTTDVPSAGTMTARALARMYAALIGEVDGVRLVSPSAPPGSGRWSPPTPTGCSASPSPRASATSSASPGRARARSAARAVAEASRTPTRRTTSPSPSPTTG